MKTHIKHLACLALLSLIPLIVMGQFRTFTSNFIPTIQSSIVRSISNTKIIVAKNIPYATFSVIDLTSVYYERMIPLPTNIIVRDFEILGKYVFFCGDDGAGVAYTGWFDYNYLYSTATQVFITNHSVPPSTTRVERLNKMDVYIIGNEYHIVAVGTANMSGTHYGTIGDIAIDITTNTVTSTEFQLRPNGREYISDVVATNNFVVSANPNYTTPTVYIVKYDKPTVAGSNIFATPTYNYPMREYVHAAEYMKEGVLVTNVGGNLVATLIPYKSHYLILTAFNCTTFPNPTSIIDRKIVSITSTNPVNLQLKDFAFSPVSNEYTILTHDDTCSQISIFPLPWGAPMFGYSIPFYYLQSIGNAPTYPFASFVGYNSFHLPYYVIRWPALGPTGCFPSISNGYEDAGMNPVPDTVSSVNFSPNYNTTAAIITTYFFNCGMDCY